MKINSYITNIILQHLDREVWMLFLNTYTGETVQHDKGQAGRRKGEQRSMHQKWNPAQGGQECEKPDSLLSCSAF